MKNYNDSDYAVNKYASGIVYRFRDQVVEITLGAYLAENPEKSEQDFLELKVWSDANYHAQDRAEDNQTHLNVPLHAVEYSREVAAPSPEETYINQLDQQDNLMALRQFWGSGMLTETQKRRFFLQTVQGLSSRKIADYERVSQRAIIKSLHAAEKKIRWYFLD